MKDGSRNWDYIRPWRVQAQRHQARKLDLSQQHLRESEAHLESWWSLCPWESWHTGVPSLAWHPGHTFFPIITLLSLEKKHRRSYDTKPFSLLHSFWGDSRVVGFCPQQERDRFAGVGLQMWTEFCACKCLSGYKTHFIYRSGHAKAAAASMCKWDVKKIHSGYM